MMKRLALVLLTVASPNVAHATGGLLCRPVNGAGPVLSFGFGRAIAAPVFAASIQDGPVQLRTGALVETPTLRSIVVAQSWLDGEQVMLDLVDPQVTRFEGQLRARFIPGEDAAVGTFVRNGRTWRVRCEEA